MHHALILSSRPGWAAESGLAQMLSEFGLLAQEAARLPAGPAAGIGYAVAIVRLAAGEAAPDASQLEQTGLSGAIVLTCGAAPTMPLPAQRHLAEPVDASALATALAGAGYALPLPDGAAMARRVSQLVDDDPAVMAELIVSLLATNQSDLDNFRQACTERRWPDVRASAHRIKGTAYMTGADALAALSQRVENLARQGHGEAVLALAALYLPAVQRLSQTAAALLK